MTTKHTPTPWVARPLEAGMGGGRYRITGGKLGHYQVGEVYNFNSHEQNAANAAFIVRMVNHHEALVEALRLVAADREFNEIERVTRNAVQDALDALDADNA